MSSSATLSQSQLHLIAVPYELAKNSLSSLCETTRDLLLTYYIKHTDRPQPGTRERIRSCYLTFLQNQEIALNTAHEKKLTEIESSITTQFSSLQARNFETYCELQLRALFNEEKKLLQAEIEQNHGRIYTGPIFLKQFIKTSTSSTVAPGASTWKRTFTEHRWLQLLINRAALTPQQIAGQKKQILVETEDYYLFRTADFLPDNSNDSIVKPITMRKSIFQIFAERAIMHFEQNATQDLDSAVFNKKGEASNHESTIRKLDLETKKSLFLRSLIQTYIAFQRMRGGPIDLFAQLYPAEDLSRSRLDSGRMNLDTPTAAEKIEEYSGRIVKIIEAHLAGNQKNQTALPELLHKKINDYIKHTNWFYREAKDLHLTFSDFDFFFSIINEERKLEDPFSHLFKAFNKASNSIATIEAFSAMEHDKAQLPLSNTKTTAYVAPEETLTSASSLFLGLVKNQEFTSIIVSLKNMLYTFLNQRPDSEKQFIKELYIKKMQTREDDLNKEHEKQLTLKKTQLEKDFREIAKQDKILFHQLVISGVLEEEELLLYEEFKKLVAESLLEKETLISLETKKPLVTPTPSDTPAIYGYFELKIDEQTYTKHRWKELFLNQQTSSSTEKERLRNEIDLADDCSLVTENFAEQGGHTSLGRFAAIVFDYTAFRALEIIEQYSPKVEAFPTSRLARQPKIIPTTLASQIPAIHRSEYLTILAMNSILSMLASLHYLRQELLKLRKYSFDPACDTKMDQPAELASCSFSEECSKSKESIAKVVESNNSDFGIEESIVNIINTQAVGISRTISALYRPLTDLITYLSAQIEHEFTRDDLAHAQDRRREAATPKAVSGLKKSGSKLLRRKSSQPNTSVLSVSTSNTSESVAAVTAGIRRVTLHDSESKSGHIESRNSSPRNRANTPTAKKLTDLRSSASTSASKLSTAALSSNSSTPHSSPSRSSPMGLALANNSDKIANLIRLQDLVAALTNAKTLLEPIIKKLSL